MSKMTPTGKWYYSFDEDDWNCSDGYDTPKDALADGRESAPDWADECGMEADERMEFLTCGTLFVGQGYRFEPVVDAGRVLEQLREDADEETCACHDTDYLEGPTFRASKEERAAWNAKVDDLSSRLTQTFNQWAKETDNLPYFIMISDVAEHPILREVTER